MSRASVEGLPLSPWGSFPGLAKLADYVGPEVEESGSLLVWKSVSYRLCNFGSLEDGPSTATGGLESGWYRGRAGWTGAGYPPRPGPWWSPSGGGSRGGQEEGPRGGQPEEAGKGGGGPFGSPEAASGEGGAGCLRYPPFQGLLGPLQAAVGGRAGEGQTPDPDPGLPPTLWPHTFPPPGGLPPPASPRGVYAGMPGDPPQLHARRPPLRALPGPSPARRETFAKMGDLRLLRNCPVPWKRRCYRRRS